MAAPLELRHYFRKATFEDVKAGLQPIRQGADLYAPPVLQWRYRERVKINDAETLHWSEWQDVPAVREE